MDLWPKSSSESSSGPSSVASVWSSWPLSASLAVDGCLKSSLGLKNMSRKESWMKFERSGERVPSFLGLVAWGLRGGHVTIFRTIYAGWVWALPSWFWANVIFVSGILMGLEGFSAVAIFGSNCLSIGNILRSWKWIAGKAFLLQVSKVLWSLEPLKNCNLFMLASSDGGCWIYWNLEK